MLPSLRHSLLSLPPSLRVSLYQNHQQSRSFSASQSRKSPVQDALLYGPTLLLDTIHSTGLPWHTAIPIAALVVRGFLVYHVSALPARKAAIIRANLQPLAAARFRSEISAYRDNIMERRVAAAFAGKTTTGFWGAMVETKFRLMKFWLVLRSSHKTGKEFGAPVFSWWRSPVNLGMLIAMTEAVRIKCGSREGLLGVLAKPLDRQVDPETARRAAMSSDEIMVERLEAAMAAKQAAAAEKASATTPAGEEAALDAQVDAEMLADSATHLSKLNTNVYAGSLDPTLRTEGAAWFPDLTLVDSSLALPLMLSATMAITILARPSSNSALRPPPARSNSAKPKSNAKASKDERPDDVVAALAAMPPPPSMLARLSNGQKFGLSLSVVFFFAAMKLPVAVLLYLMPSMAFGWLQTRWLDLRYPLPEVIRPCRRPVRVKVRQEFRDA